MRLRNYFLVADRNNHFDAQIDISQRDNYGTILLVAACLSTETGKRGSLMSVTKIWRTKILIWK